ncbi:MAG: hypothetical protein JSV78_02165 [Phycisphaerales bacterium]|nr:MAG: hypothetical protein JSV78_02165 [Phycisphaerales bacterium]
MNASQALQCESHFLSGVGANFEAFKGKILRGSIWRRVHEDESDQLRALMAQHRNYDRDRLKSLPANRRIELQGFERRFIFGKRPTGVAVASTLCSLEHFAAGESSEGPPIGLGELRDHVRRLVGDSKVPHIIGVCSPSGFTQEAKSAKLELPEVTLLLIEPHESGGYKVIPTSDEVDHRLVELFDPETTADKHKRILEAIDEHSADILTGGLSASSIATELNLPEHLVRRAFDERAEIDPELRVTRQDGQCLLYPGAVAPTQERRRMNVIDRIKQLFSSEGDEQEKINVLSERRAALAQRRDRLYGDIAKLEKKEAELLEEGKAAKSHVPRRRIAAQLAQVRKDIARLNTTTGMLNQQVNIISTDIHNLTLIQQGEMAQLPDTEELTQNAVKAEEMLESLRANSELVGGLETGMADAATSEEELAILAEFEASDEPPVKEEEKVAKIPERAVEPPSSLEEPPSPAEQEPKEKTRDADPEAN